MDIQYFLKKAYEKTIYKPYDTSRLLEVHPSQIPLCPHEFLYRYFSAKGQNTAHLDADLHLEMGHAVHEVFQQYFAESFGASMIGQYVCKVCGHVHSIGPHPIHCEQCGSDTIIYGETAINYKGVVGHIDCILRQGDEYAILDFKTTSLKYAKHKAEDLPFNYLCQITSYAYCLYKQYGIKASRLYMLFIPKEAPYIQNLTVWESPCTDAILKQARQSLLYQRQLKQEVLNLASTEEYLEKDYPKCGNPFCPACGRQAPKPPEKMVIDAFNAWEASDKLPIIQRVKLKGE